jgi:integrase
MHEPKLCLHRASGQGYVTDPATGREVYLGAHGSPACQRGYEAWLAMFRARAAPCLVPGGQVSTGALFDAHRTHAEGWYQKRGKGTSELRNLRSAARFVGAAGLDALPAADFRPSHLRLVREAMVRAGLARETVNGHVGRLVRVWSWGVEQELVPAATVAALREVRGLAAGRTAAPEPQGVGPVREADVLATLPRLWPPHWRDVVLFQRAAGLRPAEALAVRGCDLDRTAEPWLYTIPPEWNKTHHRGRPRVAWLGPKARTVLLPRLEGRPAEEYVFPGLRRGMPLSARQYREVVRDACLEAGVTPWTPNQLRHSAATELRAACGAELARVVLGHTSLSTTEIYAEVDAEKARSAMERYG